MTPHERLTLIHSIAVHLQAEFVTRDINTLLTGYGVDGANVASVSSKRVYATVLLSPAPDRVLLNIARDLNLAPGEASVASGRVQSYLESNGLHECERDFKRALAHVETDPDQALASASSFLESICKAILHDLGLPCPATQAITSLVAVATRALQLSPDQHADVEIKRILGGLSNVASGIGVIRTKFSAAHGRGPSQARLWSRHARLSINAAAAVALFLLETHRERGTPKV